MQKLSVREFKVFAQGVQNTGVWFQGESKVFGSWFQGQEVHHSKDWEGLHGT